MVSSPEIIDPTWVYQVDQGYSIRRPKWSRPRRRYTLEYLGQSTAFVRLVRSFLQAQRLGALEFAWAHPTAIDVVTVQPTTPVTLIYQHGLFSGQWIGVSNTPNPTINGGIFQVTVTSDSSVTLNGTTAAGITGTGTVVVYLPRARGVFSDDTWQSPATLIGPDQNAYAPGGLRSGFYNFTVVVEEQF